ncbi:MAG: acetyl-CoA C-acetyltransferase [Deltaproteobacteria bacterium]|nr:acetyl-CoA C-acetyltransferase [Deltaproteobacteria bacterium]
MTSYILDAVRTPRGRGKAGKGALSGVHPQELLAPLLPALAERNGFDPQRVDDVVIGVVSQAGEQGSNLARNAVLASGWPIEVTGVSLNRFCGSGVQAVSFGAMGVGSGMQDLVVAGGVESMSRVPMGSDGGGTDGQNARLRETYFQVPQGISADLIATRERFSRAELDSFALGSHRKAARAIEEKRFARSLVAVRDRSTGALLLDRDELVRPDTSLEGLSQLKPSFVEMGKMAAGPNGETLDQLALRGYPDTREITHLHTAGNSSGLADGAAAVLLASERWVKESGRKPRAKILAAATIGSEPVIMLTAPAPVSLKALKMAGMTAKDIDVWEINEAFAAVVLETVRKLDLDPDRVNPNGGAIALGHPLGATGAMLIGTALDELERSDKSTALVTMCIGGGQGVAMILERV